MEILWRAIERKFFFDNDIGVAYFSWSIICKNKLTDGYKLIVQLLCDSFKGQILSCILCQARSMCLLQTFNSFFLRKLACSTMAAELGGQILKVIERTVAQQVAVTILA